MDDYYKDPMTKGIVYANLSSFTYGPYRHGKAIGRWEAVLSVNHPIETEITVGVTTTDSSSKELSNSESLTTSMSLGVEFMGIGGGTCLSDSYESSFKKTVSRIASMA